MSELVSRVLMHITDHSILLSIIDIFGSMLMVSHCFNVNLIILIDEFNLWLITLGIILPVYFLYKSVSVNIAKASHLTPFTENHITTHKEISFQRQFCFLINHQFTCM